MANANDASDLRIKKGHIAKRENGLLKWVIYESGRGNRI